MFYFFILIQSDDDTFITSDDDNFHNWNFKVKLVGVAVGYVWKQLSTKEMKVSGWRQNVHAVHQQGLGIQPRTFHVQGKSR